MDESSTEDLQINLVKIDFDSIRFKQYKTRYFMLFIFAMGCVISPVLQLTYASVQDIIMPYYNVTTGDVNLMSMIFMIEYIPMSFVGSFLMEKKGLKFTASIGAFCIFVGAWMRYLPRWLFDEPSQRWWFYFIGQAVAGLGQPLLGLNNIALMASNWFGDKERTIAATIGALSNIIGNGIILVIAPVIVNGSGDNLKLLYIVEAGWSTLIFILVIFFFQDKPPTPPSISASVDLSHENANFFKHVFKCLTNGQFVLLSIGYGIGYASFVAITTLLNEILVRPYGYSADQVGIIGGGMIGSGVLGALIFGAIVDATKKFKVVLKILVGLTSIGVIMFMYIIGPDRYVLILVSFIITGFGIIALVPVSLECAVEVTYPIPEGTSTGLMNMLGTALGVGLILTMDKLQDPTTHEMKNSVYIASSLMIISCLCLLFFNGEMKRLKSESKKSEK